MELLPMELLTNIAMYVAPKSLKAFMVVFGLSFSQEEWYRKRTLDFGSREAPYWPIAGSTISVGGTEIKTGFVPVKVRGRYAEDNYGNLWHWESGSIVSTQIKEFDSFEGDTAVAIRGPDCSLVLIKNGTENQICAGAEFAKLWRGSVAYVERNALRIYDTEGKGEAYSHLYLPKQCVGLSACHAYVACLLDDGTVDVHTMTRDCYKLSDLMGVTTCVARFPDTNRVKNYVLAFNFDTTLVCMSCTENAIAWVTKEGSLLVNGKAVNDGKEYVWVDTMGTELTTISLGIMPNELFRCPEANRA